MEKCARAGQATDENIVQCIRFAVWIPTATDTHSEYVIFIGFKLQEWLCERAI